MPETLDHSRKTANKASAPMTMSIITTALFETGMVSVSQGMAGVNSRLSIEVHLTSARHVVSAGAARNCIHNALA